MNSDNDYMFIQKKGNESDKLYEAYYTMAAGYIANVILLTNSLLFILMKCHIDKKIDLPLNSMVGSFIRSIENNNFYELQDILSELKMINKFVNLVKHSLIGMTDDPKTTSIYLWDMKTRQDKEDI